LIPARWSALQVLFRPHKPVAALGNLVLQLHVHVIARYIEDNTWPRPAWGMAATRPYAPGELIERGLALGTALA
jgi:diadenosine tetraphosphate (Ap4A) HIT family hydrolase